MVRKIPWKINLVDLMNDGNNSIWPVGKMNGISMITNKFGQYVPSIPEPLSGIFGLPVCSDPNCRKTFWTLEHYKGHFALEHILFLLS